MPAASERQLLVGKDGKMERVATPRKGNKVMKVRKVKKKTDNYKLLSFNCVLLHVFRFLSVVSVISDRDY